MRISPVSLTLALFDGSQHGVIIRPDWSVCTRRLCPYCWLAHISSSSTAIPGPARGACQRGGSRAHARALRATSASRCALRPEAEDAFRARRTCESAHRGRASRPQNRRAVRDRGHGRTAVTLGGDTRTSDRGGRNRGFPGPNLPLRHERNLIPLFA